MCPLVNGYDRGDKDGDMDMIHGVTDSKGSDERSDPVDGQYKTLDRVRNGRSFRRYRGIPTCMGWGGTRVSGETFTYGNV